jgi:opacity protein-like surface antigen
MTRRVTIPAAAWLVVILAAADASAQSASFARQGIYVSVMASPGTTFKGGDFDGRHYLYDSEQVVLIPDLSSADALGFAIGGRFERGAIEISYVQAKHPASFAGARGMATSRVVNIDGKYFFAPRSRLQPYLSGGAAIPWLFVEGGSMGRGSESDATFVGVGINAGAGLAVYVHPRVAVSAGYNYRLAIFPRVKGASGSFVDIDDKAEPIGRNGHFAASMSFTF